GLCPAGRKEEKKNLGYAPGPGLCSSVPTLSAMPPLAKHAPRDILGALRDGFAARDVRLGFALPEARKEEFGLCHRPGLVQFSSYAVGYAAPRKARPSQNTARPTRRLRRSRCEAGLCPAGRKEEKKNLGYAPGPGLCSSVPTLSAMPPLAKHALREILGALRDGFAARDVRLGFALPEGREREIWVYAPGS